ncbi:hypothetical protein [Streptomyces sp. C10-9-1]|uniref:hypothetical protein n=1 Tax=Streptomyces sp. C10-9-1 TaxID=1859285 RepID=UPI003D756BE0
MTRPAERPDVTTPSTTDLDEATALRRRPADRLAAAGHIRTPAVDRAVRAVPRHAFAPEVSLVAAYADDVVATRHSPDGTTTSSVSAPWLRADMLEAARVQPGRRVLEIGSGGCNAALTAGLVGPTGHVTTLDIDPALTERAVRFLRDGRPRRTAPRCPWTGSPPPWKSTPRATTRSSTRRHGTGPPPRSSAEPPSLGRPMSASATETTAGGRQRRAQPGPGGGRSPLRQPHAVVARPHPHHRRDLPRSPPSRARTARRPPRSPRPNRRRQHQPFHLAGRAEEQRANVTGRARPGACGSPAARAHQPGESTCHFTREPAVAPACS